MGPGSALPGLNNALVKNSVNGMIRVCLKNGDTHGYAKFAFLHGTNEQMMMNHGT
jgi:hypothetical protein